MQQILVLRELGLGLAEIAEAVDSETDTLVALKCEHGGLLGERDRLTRMADTVARTIAGIVGETDVTVRINRPENLFEGFDHMQYDDEARDCWPEEFEQSRCTTVTVTVEDIECMQRELTVAMIRMAEFMAAGTSVGDGVVQVEIHTQYQGICRMWIPNRDVYECRGQMYVDDERFKANYERIAEGLAEYQRDARGVYADERLGE